MRTSQSNNTQHLEERVCRDCGEKGHKTLFKQKNTGGKIYYTNMCKACDAEYKRRYYEMNKEKVKDRVKAWKEENRDKVRASATSAKAREKARSRYRKRISTPEGRLKERERQREMASVRRRKNGVKPKEKYVPIGETTTWLPIEPFSEYLKDRLKRYSYAQLSLITGYDERQIKRWRDKEDAGSPITKVSLDKVDDFLVKEGSTSLYELYPE